MEFIIYVNTSSTKIRTYETTKFAKIIILLDFSYIRDYPNAKRYATPTDSTPNIFFTFRKTCQSHLGCDLRAYVWHRFFLWCQVGRTSTTALSITGI